jgi:hypothetical protein
MFLQTGTQPVPTVIASATKAAPCVLTFTTLPAAVVAGDVVVPKGTGWRSIDDKPFGVQAIDVTNKRITLYASDTSKETLTMSPTANLAEVIFQEFCMATATFTSPPGSDIDVTTLCDDFREVVAGLPALATWGSTGFWDSTDNVQATLGILYRSGAKAIYKAIFRDLSGLTFLATTTSMEVATGVDQAVTLSLGGTVSGGIRRIVPEGVGGTPVMAMEDDPRSAPSAPTGNPPPVAVPAPEAVAA